MKFTRAESWIRGVSRANSRASTGSYDFSRVSSELLRGREMAASRSFSALASPSVTGFRYACRCREPSISKVKGDSPCACSYVPRSPTSWSWSNVAKVASISCAPPLASRTTVDYSLGRVSKRVLAIKRVFLAKRVRKCDTWSPLSILRFPGFPRFHEMRNCLDSPGLRTLPNDT